MFLGACARKRFPLAHYFKTGAICTNSYSIYTVKIAGFSAIYILIANSGNYLHLSIVVHYKTVCNNKLLSVNFNINSNY